MTAGRGRPDRLLGPGRRGPAGPPARPDRPDLGLLGSHAGGAFVVHVLGVVDRALAERFSEVARPSGARSSVWRWPRRPGVRCWPEAAPGRPAAWPARRRSATPCPSWACSDAPRGGRQASHPLRGLAEVHGFASQPAGRACPLPSVPLRSRRGRYLQGDGGRDKYMTGWSASSELEEPVRGRLPGGLLASWTASPAPPRPAMISWLSACTRCHRLTQLQVPGWP